MSAFIQLPDFVIVIVGNGSDTGPGFSAHSTTINMQYAGPTGVNSNRLLVEVLGDSYVNPSPGSATITSNASPSTSGLSASSVTMTSGVLNGTVALSATPGTTLTGQLGMTTGTGSIGSASSVLSPNPAVGGTFTIASPFTFYQTYTFAGFSSNNQAGSISAGTRVEGIQSLPAALGDFVWHDLNADGDQDAGEPGIPGVTVNLLDASSAVVGTTTTDANGLYLFSGLTPGTYSVQFVQPAGYVPTAANAGGDDAKDSDADSVTGLTGPYTLASGETNLTVDAGFYQTVSVGDFVWHDLDADGLQDAGEPGINGVTLTLTGTTGFGTPVTLTTTTAGNGGYLFSGLAPGTYTVTVDASNFAGAGALAAFAASPTLVGPDRTVDSNPNPSGTTPAALPGGSSDLTLDFGYYQPAALGDFVWHDLNADGDQDAGEPGIPNVTVQLLAADGTTVLATTSTDANGLYLFSGLTPGTYSVQFVAPGGGFIPSPKDAGGDDAKDSDADLVTGVTGPYTLSSGQTDLTVDAGFYTLGINLVKLTNGTDNNVPTGPVVPVGNTVTFTYVVTNTGNVPLANVVVTDDNGTQGNTADDFVVTNFTGGDANNNSLLDLTETWTYTATRIATAGQYVNFGTVTGKDVNNPDNTVTDTDIDHHFGADPKIQIVKLTNGTDNDAAPGLLVPVGTPITWTYVVTAVGSNEPIEIVVVTDDNGTPGNAGDDFIVSNFVGGDTDNDALLDPGETWTYTAAGGPAIAGQYTNNATVDGEGHLSNIPVTAENPDNYYGQSPGIDIEKTTNGPTNANSTAPDYDNEDAPNGPGVPVLTPGSTVTWTYKVTNTGSLPYPFGDVAIVDDNGTPGNTSDDLSTTGGQIAFFSVQSGNSDNVLDPGEVWLYQATGTVQTLATTTGSSTVVDFSHSGGSVNGAVGNIRTFAAGGVSVNASAFSKSGSTWAEAYLGRFSGGLGVTDTGEDGSNNSHTVDNIGRDNYILFEFSESVVIDAAYLGYVSGDSDLTIWIGTIPNAFANHQTLSDALLASLGFTEVNLGGSNPRSANLNSGNLAGNVLVIAAKTDDCNDRFKVDSLTFEKTQSGLYENLATVTVPGATDGDYSHYTNPSAPEGEIRGTKYRDVSGNGLNLTAGPNSPADVPMAGVKIYLDFDNDGSWDGNEPYRLTDVNGNYSFTGLAPGDYIVREVVPAGFVRTGPATTDKYTVSLTGGAVVTGRDFANAEKCNACTITCVSFKVVHSNGTWTTVSDLRGNTRQGDVIKVTFTVNASAGQTHDVTFVSYTAPSSSFNANTASQQEIYDLDTGSFGPGTHTLTVSVPNSYYQVDFVCGLAIDQLGPAGSNIFYTPQGRLESADNGGTRAYGPNQVTGQFATVGFWKSTNGQTVIKSLDGGYSHTELGHWLATTFPTLFGASNQYTGADLAGKTNSQIATIFRNLSTSTTIKTTYAQAFAAALGIYADTRSLGGQSLIDNGNALKYGINTSLAGGGVSEFSIGSSTAAFPDLGATPTVLEILQTVDANFSPATGKFYGGNSSITTAANNVLNGINTGGDIALVTSGTGAIADDQPLATTLHPMKTGTIVVAVDPLTGGLVAGGERIDSAIASLNASLAAEGVTLVQVPASPGVEADVYLHFAATSAIGGVADGVLGVAQAGGEVTIVVGWDYYFGGDPAGIGVNQYDFETVVVHELSHALDLGHSTDANSVMYPSLGTAQSRRQLTAADLAVIEDAHDGSLEPLRATRSTLGLPSGPRGAAVAVAPAASALVAGPVGTPIARTPRATEAPPAFYLQAVANAEINRAYGDILEPIAAVGREATVSMRRNGLATFDDALLARRARDGESTGEAVMHGCCLDGRDGADTHTDWQGLKL